jgi:hypothetical protein
MEASGGALTAPPLGKGCQNCKPYKFRDDGQARGAARGATHDRQGPTVSRHDLGDAI